MDWNICINCGCDIKFHVSDFVLNGDWKDGCQHNTDGKVCTCDAFSPTLREFLMCLGNANYLEIMSYQTNMKKCFNEQKTI